MPHGRFWHSSDVKHEGRSTREARVITNNLLYEQLVKDLFLCCVPQRETRLLGKAYHAASLLGCALKRTGCSISKLTWTEGRAGLSPRSRPSYYRSMNIPILCLYREAMHLQCFPPTRYMRARTHKLDDLFQFGVNPLSLRSKYFGS